MNSSMSSKNLEKIREYIKNNNPDKLVEFEHVVANKTKQKVYLWLNDHSSTVDMSNEFKELVKDYFFSIH